MHRAKDESSIFYQKVSRKMNEKKNQNKALWLILGIILAAAVIVGLYFGVRAIIKASEEPAATQPVGTQPVASQPVGTEPASEPVGSTESTTPAMTNTPEMDAAKTKEVYLDESLTTDDARLDKTVATCGDYSMNNRDAQIFYAMQYYGFMNENGMFAAMYGLDSTKPLHEQASLSGDLTWEQYFLMASMDDCGQFAAFATKAAKEGYTLPQADLDQLESVRGGLRDNYAAYGYDSADAFVQGNFGPSVRFEDYARYLELYFYAMSYENNVYENLSVTEEEINAYYDEHASDFMGVRKDQPNINVRHILITYSTPEGATEMETKDARAAAKTKAEELLASFLENPSEENFAEMAKANTEDPGSKENGGLYEDVYPGQMVEPFDEWCFDQSRQPGDTGVVETSYGFHVMYFVSKTNNYYWKTVSEQNIRRNRMYALVEEVMGEYPVVIDYENVVLCPLPKQATE